MKRTLLPSSLPRVIRVEDRAQPGQMCFNIVLKEAVDSKKSSSPPGYGRSFVVVG